MATVEERLDALEREVMARSLPDDMTSRRGYVTMLYAMDERTKRMQGDIAEMQGDMTEMKGDMRALLTHFKIEVDD